MSIILLYAYDVYYVVVRIWCLLCCCMHMMSIMLLYAYDVYYVVVCISCLWCCCMHMMSIMLLYGYDVYYVAVCIWCLLCCCMHIMSIMLLYAYDVYYVVVRIWWQLCCCMHIMYIMLYAYDVNYVVVCISCLLCSLADVVSSGFLFRFKVLKLTILFHLNNFGLVLISVTDFSFTAARTRIPVERPLCLSTWRAIQFGHTVWNRGMFIFCWLFSSSIAAMLIDE